MKKLFFLLFIVFSGIFLSGCTLPGTGNKLAALQISSLPRATVFLDNKHIGRTPYYDEKLKPGEYSLKLLSENEGSESGTWNGKIKLTPETLTVVNWQFGATSGNSEGEVLSLEKIDGNNIEVAVISTPDQAQVTIDREVKGSTPLILKDISGGDHDIGISKDGYNQRSIRTKTIQGYRLTINAQLSKTEVASNSGKLDLEATDSAKPKNASVVIKETPTGWLRVREEASLAASESAKVNTGETFPYLEEKEGWIKIEYQKGKTGWVSSQYVDKKE